MTTTRIIAKLIRSGATNSTIRIMIKDVNAMDGVVKGMRGSTEDEITSTIGSTTITTIGVTYKSTNKNIITITWTFC